MEEPDRVKVKGTVGLARPGLLMKLQADTVRLATQMQELEAVLLGVQGRLARVEMQVGLLAVATGILLAAGALTLVHLVLG
jgi:hypothetical protein